MSAIDDTTLLKMAEAEILGEAKRAAVRHSIAGISGWQPFPKPNKTFLTNTLLQTMASNKHLTRRKNQKSEKTERKLLQGKSKKDMTTNFIYQKPKNQKERLSLTTKSNNNSSYRYKSVDFQSKTNKEHKKNKIKKVKKHIKKS